VIYKPTSTNDTLGIIIQYLRELICITEFLGSVCLQEFVRKAQKLQEIKLLQKFSNNFQLVIGKKVLYEYRGSSVRQIKAIHNI
jgi:hypothetical protein